MKKLILALAVFVSSAASAEPVVLKTLALHSDRIEGIRKLTITPAAGGKLRVTIDPNRCNPRGVCTKMAVFSEVVEAKLIRDSRPADGDLLMQLTPLVKLSVGSGFTPDHHIEIVGIIASSGGGEQRLVLTPEVTVQVGQ